MLKSLFFILINHFSTDLDISWNNKEHSSSTRCIIFSACLQQCNHRGSLWYIIHFLQWMENMICTFYSSTRKIKDLKSLQKRKKLRKMFLVRINVRYIRGNSMNYHRYCNNQRPLISIIHPMFSLKKRHHVLNKHKLPFVKKRNCLYLM